DPADPQYVLDVETQVEGKDERVMNVNHEPVAGGSSHGAHGGHAAGAEGSGGHRHRWSSRLWWPDPRAGGSPAGQPSVTLLRPRKLARFRVASDTLPNPTSWYPDMEVVMRPNHARIAVRWLPAVIPFVFSVAYTGGVAAQQPQNAEYTAAIRQYTTEPFFLTPLVDYLPASSTVPTPKDVLGHVVGQPDVLHYPEEIYRYMREVEKASPRVKVFSIGETEEGREMLLVVVA